MAAHCLNAFDSVFASCGVDLAIFDVHAAAACKGLELSNILGLKV